MTNESKKTKPFVYTNFYNKLSKKRHTTIRKSTGGRKVGYWTDEIVKDEGIVGSVKIVRMRLMCLDNVSEELLIEDTDQPNRRDAYKLIQSFYVKPINFHIDLLWIFFLEKIEVVPKKYFKLSTQKRLEDFV